MGTPNCEARDGVEMTIAGGLQASSKEILNSEIQIPQSPGRYEKFIAAVKSRKETLTPARASIRAAKLLSRQTRASWKL